MAVIMGKYAASEGQPTDIVMVNECATFGNNTIMRTGKLKGQNNKLQYLLPFFPRYLDTLLQLAPYFFIEEKYLSKVEEQQPIYDLEKYESELENMGILEINERQKVIIFHNMDNYLEDGMIKIPQLPSDQRYIYSSEAKSRNKRQHTITDADFDPKYSRGQLVNTLGYCTGKSTQPTSRGMKTENYAIKFS